ncbi:MAG: glycosyltransferase family 2 protein [Butyrivibrio sp.]|nr:glycosyltransferase family 2 protein [Butyrivibrio sp.]
MYEELTKLIEEGNFKEALYVFQEEFSHLDEKTPGEKASLYLLEATIWEALMDSTSEFDAISMGLSYDGRNYELFYMLGLMYINSNVNKAYLCMERALFFCRDEEDRRAIKGSMDEVRAMAGFDVRKVSVMILSYNDLDLLKESIDALLRYNPADSFELVVVDNDSSEEGVKEYLKKKSAEADCIFKLILGDENLGFPKGCNLGAKNCDPENDIFFLNNDAVLTLNALFWLRMGLYENRNVGAVSAFSNSASLQEIEPSEFVKDDSDDARCWHKKMPYKEAIEIFEKYAAKKAGPLRDPYIKRFRLTGFALLISRPAISTVAPDMEVFDEAFSPGYFEDDDLGIRIARAGFDQYLCRNSFIYHNGGGGFAGHDDAMEAGRERFKEKWGFDVWGYCLPWYEAADMVKKLAEEGDGCLRILDLTCGFGITLSYIKSICPDVFAAGACGTPFEAGIASHLADEVVYGEVNTMRLPWPDHSFDVVMVDREYVSKAKAMQFLKIGGICIDAQDMD